MLQKCTDSPMKQTKLVVKPGCRPIAEEGRGHCV